MDSLLFLDGSISTDPVHIHDRLTEEFAEHFICPQKHRHSPLQEENTIEHEKFLKDKEYFKSVVMKISDKIQEKHWTASGIESHTSRRDHSSTRTWRRYSKRQ